jgi:hypothetical protein
MCCCQCSKPLTYGIALDQLGCDMVHQYVGQEPSGRNFNELVLDYNSEWAYMPCVMSFRCGLHCNLSYDRFIFIPGRQWFKSTFSPCISSNTYILCIYYLNTFVGLKIMSVIMLRQLKQEPWINQYHIPLKMLHFPSSVLPSIPRHSSVHSVHTKVDRNNLRQWKAL